MPHHSVIRKLKELIERDPLYEMNADDKELLWAHRHFILSSAQALPKFLQCVSWTAIDRVAEMHSLLHRWAPLSQGWCAWRGG